MSINSGESPLLGTWSLYVTGYQLIGAACAAPAAARGQCSAGTTWPCRQGVHRLPSRRRRRAPRRRPRPPTRPLIDLEAEGMWPMGWQPGWCNEADLPTLGPVRRPGGPMARTTGSEPAAIPRAGNGPGRTLPATNLSDALCAGGLRQKNLSISDQSLRSRRPTICHAGRSGPPTPIVRTRLRRRHNGGAHRSRAHSGRCRQASQSATSSRAASRAGATADRSQRGRCHR